jgi:tetratricopeptide (TPR) repeat protein
VPYLFGGGSRFGVLPRKERRSVRDEHPSLETLARWLAGELEHEQVRRELAPHFLEACPVCRTLRDEIERLLEESGHWSESVAVMESREALALLGLLVEGSHAERMRRAEEIEELYTWGVCQLLLKQVQEQVFSDPVRAVEMAQLAVRLSRHLGAAYDLDWVMDLRARAHAHLGNAYRVLGELKAAEGAFLQAAECLEKGGTGDPRILAEILSLEASLRLDQRRLEEALALVDRVIALHREIDRAGLAKTLLQKAKILKEGGDLPRAIDAVQESLSELGGGQDPRLFAYARHNLFYLLTLAGRFEEAERLAPEVRGLLGSLGEPLHLVRLRWTEGNLAHGLGHSDDAEEAYRTVQREFLRLGKGLDAALVSLDLAVLLWEQGRTDELKEIAAEMMMAFESREVHREALAALALFQRACTEERVTEDLIRHVASVCGGGASRLPRRREPGT